jgi:glutamate synthase (NADPH/NADH) small chain
VLGINDPPVTIKNIEVAIIDHGWDEGWVTAEPPQARTGKKVAVIGSGPAGLCAAAQLNRAGHTVTVFERADRIGGLLMYGIPNMKLDKSLVQRRIDLLTQEGVTFVPNTEVGKSYPARKLLEEFDATVLCTGATKPRDLPIEGRQLHGVIGGGDTGTDCVGTAMRHGCKSLIQLEILPKPPLERAANNPWPEWPKVYRLDYGQEEARAIFGDDPRVYCMTARRFVGDEHGNLEGVEIVQVEWQKDDKGRFVPKEVAGTEKVVPCQLALLAMGFLGPEDQLLQQLGIALDDRSNVKASHGAYATSIKGVFAAGDCRRGQSLVVWAFNEGRGAARECDRYLMGRTDLP